MAILDGLHSFLDSELDGVFLVGHRSTIVRIDMRLYACDPVWNHQPHGKYWNFFPAQIPCDEVLPNLRGVFVTSTRPDQMCEHILRKLTCTVNIMSDGARPYEKIKRFAHVHDFEPWRWVALHDRTQFMFIAGGSVLIRGPSGFTVFHGNGFLDETTCERIGKEAGRVDVAMVPFAYIGWYPQLLISMNPMERFEESMKLKSMCLERAQMFVNIVKPKHAVPIGANLWYSDPMDNPLNCSVENPFKLKWVDGKPQFAGDYILSDGTRTSHFAHAEYDAELERHLSRFKNPMMKPTHAYMRMNTVATTERLKQKLKLATFRIPYHHLIVNNIEIDLESLRVHASGVGRKPRPYTRFVFEGPVFCEWLDGNITFEQALDTRRFLCWRDPNINNPKVFEFVNQFL